jgi:hypothetical protein
MGTSDDMADFAIRLGFNGNIQKKLGISRNPNTPLNSFTKKFIFLFTRPLGTFEVALGTSDPNLPNTPLNSFFNNYLTLTQANAQIPSWWSYGNPPVYINSVTYGSLLAMTVDFTPSTEGLYYSLEKSTSFGVTEMQKIINQLINQQSLKSFSIGPFSTAEVNAIQNGQWLSFMMQVPNSGNSLPIYPYIFTVKDFNQVRFNSANSFDYVKVSCAQGSLTGGGSTGTGIGGTGSGTSTGQTGTGQTGTGQTGTGQTGTGQTGTGMSSGGTGTGTGGIGTSGTSGGLHYPIAIRI